MKIIGKNFCYIQMEDLIYLLCNESSSFPNEIYKYLRDRDVNPMNQYCYVKIVNPKWINYIKNKNAILDFDFLASKTIPELEELCDELLSEIRRKAVIIRRNETLGNSVVNHTKDKENMKYYISQIKQMIMYKSNEKEEDKKLELQ